MPYDLMTASGISDYSDYCHPLQPHAFDDMVFIIFQRGKLENETQRSSLKPISQWFILIFVASLILHALRKVNGYLQQRMNRVIKNGVVPDYYVGSFVDAVAVFLGVALNKLGNSRAERWFLISFSIFGLIFKIFFTDNLFVMLTESNSNRITSIDQLFRANIPITVDYDLIILNPQFYIRNKA